MNVLRMVVMFVVIVTVFHIVGHALEAGYNKAVDYITDKIVKA